MVYVPSDTGSYKHGITFMPIVLIDCDIILILLDYFSIVGINNPKHLRRFQEFTGGVEQLVALRS